LNDTTGSETMTVLLCWCPALPSAVHQDIDGVDDAKEYAEVMQALQDIGVEPQDICMLLRTLSGILWLGNLKIQPVHANAVDSSEIVADAALSHAAELLGLPQQELAHAITHKQVGWEACALGGRALRVVRRVRDISA
jgi:myosin heavy subunit